MKKILFLTLFCFSVFLFSQQHNLKFEWIYTNVEKGYDHENKSELFINGVLVKTSSSTKQTEWNSISYQLPRGIHHIKLVNYAFYEGKWEEHLIENDYSIDSIFEVNLEVTKATNRVFRLKFDLDKEMVILVD